MSLLVVDHPGDRGVRRRAFSPPPPRSPSPRALLGRCARGRRSRRDVTDLVSPQDDRYLGLRARRLSGIAPITSSSSSCRRTLACGRSGSSRRAGIYPTDSSINVAIGQGKSRRPRAVARGAGRAWPLGRRGAGSGFPGRQEQDDPDRSRRRRAAGRGRAGCGCAPTSRSTGIARDLAVGRAAPLEDAAARSRCQADLRYRGFSTTLERERTSRRKRPLRSDRQHRPALARSRRLLTRVRRRARAAGRCRRSLRDHERGRRAAAAFREPPPPPPGLAPRLRADRRRLGEGRRLQHRFLADGAAAAVARASAATRRRAPRSRTIRSISASRRLGALPHAVRDARARSSRRASRKSWPVARE